MIKIVKKQAYNIWDCQWNHNDLTGPNKTYKVGPNKGNELSIAARKQRSKRFRAVSEQRTRSTRSESQRPGEKWHE